MRSTPVDACAFLTARKNIVECECLLLLSQVASKMPKASADEAAARERALVAALDKAIQVPLQVATRANTMWPTLTTVAQICNIQTASDMQVS
jgi:formiminotetrahydrofolate cyclodeaminase